MSLTLLPRLFYSLQTARGDARPPTLPNTLVGSKYLDWTVERVEQLEEIPATGYLLSHQPTKAQLLHLDTPDTENAFAVSFRTVPEDSTGVAHVLEHLALAGSEKYPVKDPFFSMLKRSQSTFMNAFTASAWTMYPFSTQNPIDFENLLSVYCDAAFFPLLDPLRFKQEGHRLAFSNPNDSQSPLTIQGVVFNEMKGVMSNPESFFSYQMEQHLHRETTFSHNSGGDPAKIPDLTYENLTQFHTTHYSLPNAKFFTYGDIPLHNHLDALETNVIVPWTQKYLNSESKTSESLEMFSIPIPPLETHWVQKESLVLSGPVDASGDPQSQYRAAVGFLTNDLTDFDKSFEMSFLASFLVDKDFSPFYKLIDSNIGTNYASSTGYSTYCRSGVFSVGLSGLSKDNVPVTFQLIDDIFDSIFSCSTQEQLSALGMSNDYATAILNSLKLSLNHKGVTQGKKYGILTAQPWTALGQEPFNVLHFSKSIQMIEAKLEKNPMYLRDLTIEMFQGNTHRLDLVVKPDPGFLTRLENEEKSRIQSIEDSLNEDQRKSIVQSSAALEQAQVAVDDTDIILPTLTLNDLSKTNQTQPQSITLENYQYVEVDTNGISYLRAFFNLDSNQFTDRQLSLIPLWSSLLGAIGTEKWSFPELSFQINKYLGAFDISNFDSYNFSEQRYKTQVKFMSYFLPENKEKVLEIFDQVLNKTQFGQDKQRIVSLLNARYQSMTTSLASNGHVIASIDASTRSSTPNPLASLRSLWNGYPQIEFTKNLLSQLDNDFDSLVSELEILGKTVFSNLDTFFVTGTTPGSEFMSELQSYFRLNSNVESFAFGPQLNETQRFHSYNLPIQINHCATVIPMPGILPGTGDFESFLVLGDIISSTFLHSQIREKGGAYGSSCSFGTQQLSMSSFYDPNTTRTFDAFHAALKWAAQKPFESQFSYEPLVERFLNESKLSIISSAFDAPHAPHTLGLQYYFGATDSHLQDSRDRLFKVSLDDVVQCAEKALNSYSNNGSCVVKSQMGSNDPQ